MSPLSSSQVPYIGSTISLLSKAGIRYEGFLHSIDQTEASVTLDHVRVFGTEDRQCERRVPQSPETFEYIIFRASDITELRVIDTPLSRPVPDPAIIRVQAKSSAAAGGTTASHDAAATADRAGGPGGNIRRRQARGPSSSGQGRQRYQPSQYQQPQQSHNQQALLMHPQQPPQTMMQQPQQGPLASPPRSQQHQQLRYRNDWYGGYRGVGGYYAQYARPPLYSTDFAAGGFVPNGVSGGGVSVGGVGGGGGRPVMQFRRYHGNAVGNGTGGGAQRHSSAGNVGGGGRGRQSRRPQRLSDGMTHLSTAAAGTGPPTRYFSDDYDFETANAEMAKLLILTCTSAPAVAADICDSERRPPVTVDLTVVADAPVVAAAEESAATTVAGLGSRLHVGYDKDRSFYDDISRVDTKDRTEAGGDSARLGGRKEAARQNALNRETFGLSGRRAVGGRLHGNNYRHRGALRRSPV